MDTSPKSCPRCASSPGRTRPRRAAEGLRALASLPGALLPLVSSFSCPACIAAYAGVLSALGLGLLFTERVLLPLVLATTAALLIASGRLVWSLPLVVYLGAAAFLVAAGWNLWLRLRAMRKELPA